MMPSYHQHQYYVLFFILFLMVNLYFLLNILLAVVLTQFSQIEKQKFRKLWLHRRKAAEHAFRLLVTRNNVDCIKFEHFCGLMQYLTSNISVLQCYLMYKALAKVEFDFDDARIISNGGSPTKSAHTIHAEDNCPLQRGLTLEKFYNVYEVLNLKWENANQRLPWFEKSTCMSWVRAPLHKLNSIVTHRYLSNLIYF